MGRSNHVDGRAIFQIWPIAEYNINARWVGNRAYRQSGVTTIPPDANDVKVTIKLPAAR
jgi:hypothetical protein